MYSRFFKRFLDFTVSLAAFIILLPLFLVITAVLWIANGGNPFFFQCRPGKKEKIFKIVKFKTMNDRKDADGNLLSDAERLTKMGKLARKTSLDELPQLLNVIKGDMSLIGPRPLLIEYLPLYNETQKRRHEVRPGITGWVQVNGRNAISWQEKFELDIWYIDNISFALDSRIICLTLFKVLKRDGINADNSATMEKFTGNE